MSRAWRSSATVAPELVDGGDADLYRIFFCVLGKRGKRNPLTGSIAAMCVRETIRDAAW
jgi:hypothetical protein